MSGIAFMMIIETGCTSDTRLSRRGSLRKTSLQWLQLRRVDPKRALAEVCTSEDSALGNRSIAGENCETAIITEKHDTRTKAGLNKGLSLLARFTGLAILVRGSLPCIRGSTYQHINKARS